MLQVKIQFPFSTHSK